MELTLAGLSFDIRWLLGLQGGIHLLLLAAGGFLLLRYRRLRGEMNLMQQHLGLMRTQMESLLQRREAETAAPADFTRQLRQVELSQRLQPALVHRGAPEKYRYVAALVEQGMDIGQIAQALHMAPAEAEQAARLAAIGRRGARG